MFGLTGCILPPPQVVKCAAAEFEMMSDRVPLSHDGPRVGIGSAPCLRLRRGAIGGRLILA
jgi:hypothetical protein